MELLYAKVCNMEVLADKKVVFDQLDGQQFIRSSYQTVQQSHFSWYTQTRVEKICDENVNTSEFDNLSNYTASY